MKTFETKEDEMITENPEHGLALALERRLPASPDAVFRALTDPGLYAAWMGPGGSTTTVLELDARPGGSLRFRVELPDGGPTFVLRGAYEDVDPPRRVAHSFAMEGDDAETAVVFELDSDGDGTRLVLTSERFADRADAERNLAGWEHQLDRLGALLDGTVRSAGARA